LNVNYAETQCNALVPTDDGIRLAYAYGTRIVRIRLTFSLIFIKKTTMKKDKLKEMPTAELINKEKAMRIAIYCFVLALLLFFVAHLWSFKRGKLEIMELITPSILLISLFVFLNILKNMRKELSSRDD